MIEESGIASRACRIERFKKIVLENVHGVERNSSPKLRALGADIGDAERHTLSQIALNLEVEVLNIRGHAV